MTRHGKRMTAIAAALLAAPPAAAQEAGTLIDGAFRDAQMAAGSRTALALSRGAARLAASDPKLSALLLERQDAADRVTVAEAGEVAARTATMPKPDAIASAAAGATAAREALRAVDERLAAVSPGYVQLTGIAPVSIRDAQALLGPDEAILLVQPTARGTYVFAVTATDARWIRAPLDAAALAGEVRVLRQALDPAGTARAGEDASPAARRNTRPAYPRARAYALYRALLAPLEPAIGRRRTLYVVAGGAFGALPPAVLVTAPPRGDDGDPAALRRTAWLIRGHALVALPSVGSLRALRAGASRGAAKQPFRGFGDPALDGMPGGDTPRSFGEVADAEAKDTSVRVKALPRLPGSREELRAMARVLGADDASLVVGADATEAAVEQADLSGTAVVAFATHGLLAGELGPLAQPALVMTPPATPSGSDDGLLTASEAAGLRLGADWVILSACNTAAADGQADGEGLSGLARGFFSAGARAVLASHWRVRDDAAAALTAGTLARYTRRPAEGRARALQGAMVAMMRDRAHPERASPAYWATFVIAGEGR